MIHSGSRNIGKKVCDYHNQIAKSLNKKHWAGVPKEWDLAFLPLDSTEGQNYFDDMTFCVGFAHENRRVMLERISDIFNKEMGWKKIDLSETVNIAHNYAKLENHFGHNVVVHRKGATSAYKDQLGIIPGSQGTASYIVRGLGNIMSFKSCSHGAGRAMGRKQAQRSLNLENEIRKLDEQGIVHGIRSEKDLDEASGAYKDISTVINSQLDLIEIVTELRPLAVIKG